MNRIIKSVGYILYGSGVVSDIEAGLEIVLSYFQVPEDRELAPVALRFPASPLGPGRNSFQQAVSRARLLFIRGGELNLALIQHTPQPSVYHRLSQS